MRRFSIAVIAAVGTILTTSPSPAATRAVLGRQSFDPLAIQAIYSARYRQDKVGYGLQRAYHPPSKHRHPYRPVRQGGAYYRAYRDYYGPSLYSYPTFYSNQVVPLVRFPFFGWDTGSAYWW
jgi:hypothetical protein